MIAEHEPPEEVPHADIELCDRLRAANWAGPTWEYFATELFRYGWTVMSAWLKNRVIATKCHEKGRGVELPYDWTVEDREDLVQTAVDRGLEVFRRALMNERWTPQRGASLKTYFLGGCILAFPNALREWSNQRRRYHNAVAASAREPMHWPPDADPYDVIDAVDALRSLTRDEKERARAIRSLLFNGYTPTDIAAMLGMTPGAVNAALFRIRQRGRADREGRKP